MKRTAAKYCPECQHPRDSHLARFYHEGKTAEGYDVQKVTLLCRMYGCSCEYEMKLVEP